MFSNNLFTKVSGTTSQTFLPWTGKQGNSVQFIGYGLETGKSWFDSQHESNILIFSKASTTARAPTRPPNHGLSGGREAGQSLPRVRMGKALPPCHHMPLLGVQEKLCYYCTWSVGYVFSYAS